MNKGTKCPYQLVCPLHSTPNPVLVSMCVHKSASVFCNCQVCSIPHRCASNNCKIMFGCDHVHPKLMERIGK
jgi:hypothetical protein